MRGPSMSSDARGMHIRIRALTLSPAWPGLNQHCDGGALAMKRYGHLRQEHSLAMSKKVHFDAKPGHNIILLPAQAAAKADNAKQNAAGEKQAIAKRKAQYDYPWWASENSVE